MPSRNCAHAENYALRAFVRIIAYPSYSSRACPICDVDSLELLTLSAPTEAQILVVSVSDILDSLIWRVIRVKKWYACVFNFARSVSLMGRSIFFTRRSVYFTRRSVHFTWRSVYFTRRSIYFTRRSVDFCIQEGRSAYDRH